jgi:hypothetical protein
MGTPRIQSELKMLGFPNPSILEYDPDEVEAFVEGFSSRAGSE